MIRRYHIFCCLAVEAAVAPTTAQAGDTFIAKHDARRKSYIMTTFIDEKGEEVIELQDTDGTAEVRFMCGILLCAFLIL